MGSINNRMLCMLLLKTPTQRDVSDPQVQEAELKRRALRPCNATDSSPRLARYLAPLAVPRGDAIWLGQNRIRTVTESRRVGGLRTAGPRVSAGSMSIAALRRALARRDRTVLRRTRLALSGRLARRSRSLKALLGMLGHAGHAATKTEHGDVRLDGQGAIKGRIRGKAEEAPPEVLEAARLSAATHESGMEVLERFKLGRVDPRSIGGHRPNP